MRSPNWQGASAPHSVVLVKSVPPTSAHTTFPAAPRNQATSPWQEASTCTAPPGHPLLVRHLPPPAPRPRGLRFLPATAALRSWQSQRSPGQPATCMCHAQLGPQASAHAALGAAYPLAPSQFCGPPSHTGPTFTLPSHSFCTELGPVPGAAEDAESRTERGPHL